MIAGNRVSTSRGTWLAIQIISSKSCDQQNGVSGQFAPQKLAPANRRDGSISTESALQRDARCSSDRVRESDHKNCAVGKIPRRFITQ
jgi:hypothetical protein